jgi:hypothetical protein
MAKLGLAQLAQLAEVVAAVAVVFSLVYVGRELGANTAAVRGSTLQSVTGMQGEILLLQASDSTLNRIRYLGDRDPSLLTELEANQYRLLLRQTWVNLQNVYFQQDLDLIDPRAWAVYHRTICGIWSSEGPRQTWTTHAHREVLDSAFVRIVESCPR